MEVDHYVVLGLPTGEEGAKLTEKEISKAYRAKALELHPDKRPDDKNAHENFQKLKSSYEILRDEKARKLFDDLLRVRREQLARRSTQDAKRRKMFSDLEERERAAFAPDPELSQRREEERIAKKLKEEVERIREMMRAGRRGGNPSEETPAKRTESENGGSGMGNADKERILKVSWEKVGGGDYSSENLREVFEEFGVVEDVVLKTSKKKGSALVVMAAKDAATAATRTMCGSLSNPLLVVPLKPVAGVAEIPSSRPGDSGFNLVGAGHKAYEDSVFEKLKKAAAAAAAKANGS